jgi:hypothetical protein
LDLSKTPQASGFAGFFMPSTLTIKNARHKKGALKPLFVNRLKLLILFNAFSNFIKRINTLFTHANQIHTVFDQH